MLKEELAYEIVVISPMLNITDIAYLVETHTKRQLARKLFWVKFSSKF